MRARMGLKLADIDVEHREVLLKDKPAALLAASAKGTVPVMVLTDCNVLDESLDIMRWALAQSEKGAPLLQLNETSQKFIQDNDLSFKSWLDKYKYADRFPELPQAYYRGQCELFLQQLEQALSAHAHLNGDTPTLADYAIFPFIRQFAAVEPDWFAAAPYPKLRDWLCAHLQSQLFNVIMQKHPVWVPES